MLLALAPACAVAQDDVVVITATRQPQPSLEVPASVDRIYARPKKQRSCMKKAKRAARSGSAAWIFVAGTQSRPRR